MSFRAFVYGACLVITVVLIYVIIVSTNSLREEQLLLAQKVVGLCDRDIKNLVVTFYDTHKKEDVFINISRIEDLKYFCLASKAVDIISFQKARHVFRLQIDVNYYSGRSVVMQGRIRNQSTIFLSDLNRDHISVRITNLGDWFLKKSRL